MMSKQEELKLANQYLEEGKQLSKQANYTESIEILEKASVLFEKWEDWEKWVEVNNGIGFNLYELCEYERGIEHINKNLKIGQHYLGRNHLLLAPSLNYIGRCYKAKEKFKIAIDYHLQALFIQKIHLGEAHIEVAQSSSYLGNCYHIIGDYKLSISFHEKALVIRKKNLGKDHAHVAISLHNLCACYTVVGDYNLAIIHILEALTIRKKTLGKEHLRVGGSLQLIGNCYNFKGDYLLSINAFQESIAIYKKKLGKEDLNVAMVINNMGIAYHFKGDYEQAISCYQEAFIIFKKKLGKEHIHKAANINNLGLCYIELKDYEQALRYCQEAFAIRKKKLRQEHPHLADSLNNIGICFLELGNYELAIDKFHLAILTSIGFFNQKNNLQNPILNEYSRGYNLLAAINGKAIAFFKKYKYQSKNPIDIQVALFTIFLGTKLITDIRRSYKTEGSKHTLAENAKKTYNYAIQVALVLAKTYQNSNQIEKIKAAHKEIQKLNPNHHIPKPENAKTLAFNFSEQSKAILLLSSLKDSEAKTTANIPAELLKKEKQLKIELNYLDKSIATQEAKGAKKDEELLSKFQSQYFDYKQEYDQLIEQFEADYPEYYRLKYAVETASVEEVQRYLSKTNPPVTNHQSTNQLISYHITPETIYIFTITSNRYQIHEVAKPSNFAELLEDFQDAITLARIKNYIQCASSLFDLLLLPALESVGSNTSKLIIIPHHELTTLTFDALIDTRKLTKEKREEITSSRDFSSLPYLVKDYDISYHYSATMLLHSVARQEQKPPQAASFVGFAPVNFDGSENVELALVSNKGQTRVMRSNRAGEKALAALPSTENEVKEVFQLFEDQQLEAKAFLYASANKENLFENAVNHKYVLIATHGYAQDGDVGLSGIYLASPQKSEERSQRSDIEESDTLKVSDSSTSRENINTQTQLSTQTPEHTNTQTHKNVNYLLHTSEAYHLQLDADLVVLSSCSSGVGKLVTGEGMMAINRGFLYAGASNIIFTHFDIPDESSGELVKVLFEQVLKGEGYASALRKAKLEVIRQDLKTPEDWAGFALIGG